MNNPNKPIVGNLIQTFNESLCSVASELSLSSFSNIENLKERNKRIIANQGELLYSHPLKTILQEYYSNAFDETINTKNFVEVTLPTKYNPYLIIKDYGRGMSKDFVKKYYTSYFSSNKRKDSIGKFGTGAKSFPCYCNYIYFKSLDKEKNIIVEYLSLIDKEKDLKCIVLGESINENNFKGTEVYIPIKEEDHFFCLIYFLHIYLLTDSINLNIVNLNDYLIENLTLKDIKKGFDPLLLESNNLRIINYSKLNNFNLKTIYGQIDLQTILSLENLYSNSLIDCKGIPYAFNIPFISKKLTQFYIFKFKNIDRIELTPAREELTEKSLEELTNEEFLKNELLEFLQSYDCIKINSINHTISVYFLFSYLKKILTRLYNLKNIKLKTLFKFKNKNLDINLIEEIINYYMTYNSRTLVIFDNTEVTNAENKRILSYLVDCQIDRSEINTKKPKYSYFFTTMYLEKDSKFFSKYLRQIVFNLEDYFKNKSKKALFANDILSSASYLKFKEKTLNKLKNKGSFKSSSTSKGNLYILENTNDLNLKRTSNNNTYLNNRILLYKNRSNKKLSILDSDREFIMNSIGIKLNQEINLIELSSNFNNFSLELIFKSLIKVEDLNKNLIDTFNQNYCVVPYNQLEKINKSKSINSFSIQNLIPDLDKIYRVFQSIKYLNSLNINIENYLDTQLTSIFEEVTKILKPDINKIINQSYFLKIINLINKSLLLNDEFCLLEIKDSILEDYIKKIYNLENLSKQVFYFKVFYPLFLYNKDLSPVNLSEKLDIVKEETLTRIKDSPYHKLNLENISKLNEIISDYLVDLIDNLEDFKKLISFSKENLNLQFLDLLKNMSEKNLFK